MYRIIGIDSKGSLIDTEVADMDDLVYELIWYSDTEGLYNLRVTKGNTEIKYKITDEDLIFEE